MQIKPNLKLGFLLVLLLLSSCSQENHLRKLQTYIQQLKINTSKHSKHTPPALAFPKPTIYQAAAMRSPFEVSQSLTNGKDSTASNPLLIYPISMLKFIGTELENNKNIAFVVAPDNKIYSVRTGDNIGNHEGKVLEINSDHVDIQELDTDSDKLGAKHVVSLKLREENQ